MRKFDFYIIRAYVGPFILTFFIVMFVLLIQFLWKWVDELVGKGIEWYVIAELMFYVSATLVPMALPLAVLLSSLMTFGNLGENYELIALKSNGVSLQKTMQPLIILMIFLSAGAFYFSNNIMPVANLKNRTLLRDIRTQKPSVSIKEGEFYKDISNFVIKIGSKDDDGVTIRDVLIYDHSNKNGNTNVTIARHGRMEMTEDKRFLVFTLFEGHNYNENVQENNRRNVDSENRPMQKASFAKEVRRIDLSEFSFSQSDESIYRNNYRMLNISQLTYFMDSLIRDRDSVYNSYVDYTADDFAFLKLYNRLESGEAVVAQRDTSSMRNGSEPSNNQELIAREDVNNPGVVIYEKREPVFDTRDSFYQLPLDTTHALNTHFMANFTAHDQEKILESAVASARNASFHTDIVTNNLEAKTRLIRKHEIEYYRKYTLSFACLILFFIGAPLGAIIRKGGLGMPVVVSVLMYVVYHVFTMVGEKSTKELAMDPFIGMWLANIVFLPFGIFLMYKATTDAPLLDAESWKKNISRIIGIFKKNKA